LAASTVLPSKARPSRAVERAAAERALALLDQIPDAKPLWPAPRQLVSSLDELRWHPSIGVACPKCGSGVGYIAVNVDTAHVVSANRRLPKRRRRRGIYDFDRLSEYQGRFEGWVEDAQAGLGKVTPTGDAPGRYSGGFAGRRAYRCRCGSETTCTERQLLMVWLHAIVDGEREVPL
jgi:hypothetical protein